MKKIWAQVYNLREVWARKVHPLTTVASLVGRPQIGAFQNPNMGLHFIYKPSSHSVGHTIPAKV